MIKYSILDLGTLRGSESWAEGVNNLGQVVGMSQMPDGSFHAYRTAPNSPINPATDELSRTWGDARGINDLGQVVGQSQMPDGSFHAYRTAPNSPINPATDDLGFGFAYSINSFGHVVGHNFAGREHHAFLFRDGTLYDLNGLIPANSGWVLSYARGINDKGQIVGDGEFKGKSRAFLLTPEVTHGPYVVSDIAIAVLKLIGGIPVGGGGIAILPGGKPIPIDPHGPRWYNLPPEMQDLLVGLVMKEMGYMINNVEVGKQIQSIASKLVGKQGEQLIKLLIKG